PEARSILVQLAPRRTDDSAPGKEGVAGDIAAGKEEHSVLERWRFGAIHARQGVGGEERGAKEARGQSRRSRRNTACAPHVRRGQPRPLPCADRPAPKNN